MTLQEKFFALIRLGLGVPDLGDSPFFIDAEEIAKLHSMAKEHAILGTVFAGLQKLPRGSYNTTEFVLRWLVQVEQIKKYSDFYLKKNIEIFKLFQDSGWQSCILKGQGLACLYPDPTIRQSGDVDIWIRSREGGSINKNVQKVISFLKCIPHSRIGNVVYHHLDWDFNGFPVEVHYRPGYFNNPFKNRYFQKWYANFDFERDFIDSKLGFRTPNDNFNAVYLLVHLYHHILFEGLGLRQVCDYFIFLQKANIDKANVVGTLRKLGLTKFAGGIMWILNKLFYLDNSKQLLPPLESEGKFLLTEILAAGNFGQSLQKNDGANGRAHSRLRTFISRTKYRSRFLFRYPSEILWDIPYRISHWIWRKGYGG
ncbi:MAG: nucleotidyltransferase family protein [Fibrobacter sp.]|nr:nucleotidyltransferase family protein [Fibrobacter sp.]